MTFILTTLVSCLIVPLKLSCQLNVAFVVNCGVFQITENPGHSSQQPFCLSDSKVQLELGRVIGSDVGSGQRVLLTRATNKHVGLQNRQNKEGGGGTFVVILLNDFIIWRLVCIVSMGQGWV